MKIKQIHIKRGQHLSDVCTIESNTILCKTLTGLGATYSEIKAARDSIIIEPNQPAIVGKCKSKVHKKDNLFGVMQKVTTDDVVDYLERTIAEKKRIKILSTPESFYKVKNAFEEIEENIYVRCFMLLDECQKYVQDNDYREDITLPIEDFSDSTTRQWYRQPRFYPLTHVLRNKDFHLCKSYPIMIIARKSPYSTQTMCLKH